MNTERFTALGGLHYGYRPAEGDAPVLVFANSLGTDLRVWDRVVALLPADWGVLRFDKPGHGLSAAEESLSIESIAAKVEDLIDHLDITRFVGVGLSVGGQIMLALALRRPVAMSHLVLADTAAQIGSAALWNSRIETVRTQGIPSIADAILSRWFAPSYAETEDFAMWRMMLERTPAEGYAQVCEALRDADYTARLGQLTMPSLVIVGSDDQSTPPALVKATADALPNARFEVIDNAGHLPCVEQPEAFTALLRSHLG